MIKKILDGTLTDRERLEFDMMKDKDMDNIEDKVHGIIYCWNCDRAMQKPKWISKIKGSGNKMNMKCQCGESTEIKF